MKIGAPETTASAEANSISHNNTSHRPKALKRVAGPVMLWGMAVGAVIAGDYYGWNAGLGLTGYWGFLIAIGIIATLYLSLSFVIGELSSAIPHSGGAYAYVRTALGRVWGFLAGSSVILQFVFAPVGVALTTGAYVKVLFPDIPVLVSAAALYLGSTGLHLIGAASSLKAEFTITMIAVAGLLIFLVVGAGNMSIDNLHSYSGGEVFPNGFLGLWATLPLAAWFFFSIETLPMASEEAKNPVKDIPRAMIASFLTLAVLGIGTLTVAAGVGGQGLTDADAPLVTAIKNIVGAQAWVMPLIAVFSILAMIASFHAIVLAYSRQAFALSRAGYLPRALSHLNRFHTPLWGLIVPGSFGYAFVVIGHLWVPNSIPVLVTLSVLFAAVSYALMSISALVLRKKQPDLNRPFKAPGGRATMTVTLVIALVLIPAAMAEYYAALLIGAMIYAVILIYYFSVARKNVTKLTLEEELHRVDEAEAELMT